METIDFNDLQSSHIRTNDGNKHYNVINGPYKGNTVTYNTLTDHWTLIIKKTVVVTSERQRSQFLFARELI